MDDDKILLELLRSGSPDAFKQLFELYFDKLYSLSAGMLDNGEDAEDIVQDSFLKFFKKIDDFKGESQIGTWLYRVVYNASIDNLRKRGSQRTSAIDEDSALPMPAIFLDWSNNPDLLLEEAELRKRLEDAKNELPDSLKSVFLLRDMEELSTKEVSQILEISQGAVKVRLHRARLLLRENLSTYFADLSEKKENINEM